MATEIERKFLVDGNDWQSLPFLHVLRFQQGYLATGNAGPDAGPETRVRISECVSGNPDIPQKAVFTVKGQGTRTRQEVEFPIPAQQARELLDMCAGRTLLKDRHVVDIDGLTWEIDVYRGPLEGLVVAEVEIPSEDFPVKLPSWLGQEVSDEKAFKNASLVSSRWTGNALAPRQEAEPSRPRAPRA